MPYFINYHTYKIFCTRFNIRLIPQWIARKQNYLTDFFNRMNDTDNWSINNESFNIMSNMYGPFSRDKFVNNLNKKVNKFNSKYFCPETSHHNAFINDWCRNHNWLCPMISCIGSAWRNWILCRARGVLLVPIWLSSNYWPIINLDGDQMADSWSNICSWNRFILQKSENLCLLIILNLRH